MAGRCMGHQNRRSRKVRAWIPYIFGHPRNLVPCRPFPRPCGINRGETYRSTFLSNASIATVMSAIGGVNGTVCTADQYSQSLVSEPARSPWISCLTHGQSIGLAVSTRPICLCSEFIPCTADRRSIDRQLRLCYHHIYMDLRTSDLLSRVFPV
jgi:hypothetical protein